MYNKGRISIRKEHETMGNEITEAEFRGYVIAKLEETNAQHAALRQTLKEEIQSINSHIDGLVKEGNEKHEKLNIRITTLENFKNQALGIVIGISALFSLVVDLFFRWWGK